jgi:hypothetical protein
MLMPALRTLLDEFSNACSTPVHSNRKRGVNILARLTPPDGIDCRLIAIYPNGIKSAVSHIARCSEDCGIFGVHLIPCNESEDGFEVR